MTGITNLTIINTIVIEIVVDTVAALTIVYVVVIVDAVADLTNINATMAVVDTVARLTHAKNVSITAVVIIIICQ